MHGGVAGDNYYKHRKTKQGLHGCYARARGSETNQDGEEASEIHHNKNT